MASTPTMSELSILVVDGKVAKNRVHRDVRAAFGLQGEQRVRRYESALLMSAGFIVMTDPESNEFCLD